MTTFLLIRHAAHDLLGRALAGRMPGVSLNTQGTDEAARLALHLKHRPIDALYASPRERALETAAPLAQALHREVLVNHGIDEINFGRWTGCSFDELAADPQWPVWCHRRTAAQPPGGETISQVQERIVAELSALSAARPQETVAVFTHGDVIKAALAHCLAISLDELERFEISPTSVSVVLVGDGGAKVHSVNETADGWRQG